MRLRKVLGDPAVIETMADGYRLAAGTTDIQRFDSLLRQARATPALPLLDEALALWRDTPVDGLLPAEAQTLADLRVDALTRRCELAVSLGRHDEAIPSLQDLVRQLPLREHLSALLIGALHAAGRPAEAVAAYDEARAALADQLGIDLSAELTAAHALLTAPAPRRVVSQLPPSVGNFVGRRRELDTLRQHITSRRIAVVSGPPGIGKTSLAIRSAHALKPDFPDGQLFVNLRGYDARQPLATTQVLAMFLRALGVPADQIPPDEPGLIDRYRTECAGRRMLIALDNASSADQVRPLLLDDPTVAHLITSRDVLAELTDPLQLDVLPAEDSLALLGTDIVTAAPEAAAEVTELCGHLPLALRIVIGNLPDHSAASIAAYAIELRGQRRIDALDILGEEKAGVRATFDISLAALDDPSRRLFQLLSVIPGHDFGIALAAAVGNVSVDSAIFHLARLATVNLLQEHAPGRYQFHDLIRVYAAEQCRLDDGELATDRMLNHYLHTIDNATATLGRDAQRLPCPPPPQDARPVVFTEPQSAADWLTTELPNLTSATRLATDFRSGWHAWQLANALHFYFITTIGPQHDWRTIATLGLAGAERDGNLVSQAEMHRSIGISLRSWLNAGWPTDDLGTLALDHLANATRLFQEAGHGYGSANAISNYGIVLYDLGRTTETLDYFRESIALARQFDLEQVEITGLSNLATALYALGQLAEAVTMNETAFIAARRGGHQQTEARILFRMGDTAHALGEFTQAEELLDRGLVLSKLLSYEYMRHATHAQLIWVRAMRTRAIDKKDRITLDEMAANVDDIGLLSSVSAAFLDGGDRNSALSLLKRITRSFQTQRPQYAGCLVMSYLAEAYLRDGQLTNADHTVRKALADSSTISARVIRGRSMTTLADVLRRQGDQQKAMSTAFEALAIQRETGHRPGEADALELLADLCGDEAYRRQADELYAAMGMVSPRGR